MNTEYLDMGKEPTSEKQSLIGNPSQARVSGFPSIRLLSNSGLETTGGHERTFIANLVTASDLKRTCPPTMLAQQDLHGKEGQNPAESPTRS
jgi:hypothetical protein